MRVQEVLIEDNNKRYLLLDQEGFPVVPVMKYIKYLDKTGKRPNTQKTYCYSLKHFFTYLEETNKDYKDIRLEDLVEFVGWLRSPYVYLENDQTLIFESADEYNVDVISSSSNDRNSEVKIESILISV